MFRISLAVAVCICIIKDCCRQDQAEQVEPAPDGLVAFWFSNYNQLGYDPMPLGKREVEKSYDPADIQLHIYAQSDTLPPEPVDWDPATLIQYMRRFGQESFGGETRWKDVRFLFGVLYLGDEEFHAHLGRSIRGRFGDPNTWQEWAAFVAVGEHYNQFSSSNVNEAITNTTIHELGHIVIDRLYDCVMYPDSHYSPCVMNNLKESVEGLQMLCGALNYRPYTRDFCNICLNKLLESHVHIAGIQYPL